MSTEKIQEILAGDRKVRGGCWLALPEELIEEQKEWHEGDSAKTTDFTTSNFWIITDSGEGPFGIDTDEELEEYL